MTASRCASGAPILAGAASEPCSGAKQATLARCADCLDAQGQAGALWSLGTLHRLGWGVAKDAVEGARWFRKAAEKGHVKAQHDLAKLLDEGNEVRRERFFGP